MAPRILAGVWWETAVPSPSKKRKQAVPQLNEFCYATTINGQESGTARGRPQQGEDPPAARQLAYSPQENAQASLRMINTTCCKSGDMPTPIKLAFKYAATLASVRPWSFISKKLGICLIISMGIL